MVYPPYMPSPIPPPTRRLNLADWTWESIPSKGGPSPRSGHRMILHGAPHTCAAERDRWTGLRACALIHHGLPTSHCVRVAGKRIILVGGFYDSGKETK